MLGTAVANSSTPLNKRDEHPCPLRPDILVGRETINIIRNKFYGIVRRHWELQKEEEIIGQDQEYAESRVQREGLQFAILNTIVRVSLTERVRSK